MVNEYKDILNRRGDGKSLLHFAQFVAASEAMKKFYLDLSGDPKYQFKEISDGQHIKLS